MIKKENVWLWVLIAEKQKHLKDRLGAFDDDEFDIAEASIKSQHVADNDRFLHMVKFIVEGESDE